MSPETINLRHLLKQLYLWRDVNWDDNPDEPNELRDKMIQDIAAAATPEVLVELYKDIRALTEQVEAMHRTISQVQYERDNQRSIQESWNATNYR